MLIEFRWYSLSTSHGRAGLPVSSTRAPNTWRRRRLLCLLFSWQTNKQTNKNWLSSFLWLIASEKCNSTLGAPVLSLRVLQHERLQRNGPIFQWKMETNGCSMCRRRDYIDALIHMHAGPKKSPGKVELFGGCDGWRHRLGYALPDFIIIIVVRDFWR